MQRIKSILNELKQCTSGNAMMLVAIGAPVLIGGAGMGVDVAQFYLYKRELQYAADQGALAGAWARGNGDTGTVYQTRASQEVSGNLSVTSGHTLTQTATLGNYGTGTNNKVIVTASISTALPFSQIVLGSNTTISVTSEAIYETLVDYTPCLYAVHPTASKALWFNGGPTVNAACGVGAMSTASNAVNTNGSSGAQNIDFAISGGGVNDGMGAFANGEIVENLTDLTDPFAGLTPPDNTTPQSLSCGSSSTAAFWTADETADVSVTYNYYRGQNAGKAADGGTVTYTGSGRTAPSTSSTTKVGETYTSEPSGSTQTVTGSMYKIAGSGPDKVYEEPVTVTTYSYANKVYTPATTSGGTMQPGTYTSFDISCDTVLASGIYVINGGTLKLNGGNSLTGNGVMFVLKNNAQVDINGGASVYLTPMSKTELQAVGVSSDDAEAMENMLIFEHPSSGNSGSKWNGGANFDINGIVYMPNSDLQLAGSMGATAECLMIISSTLKISGTADLATFCPSGKSHDVVVGGGGTRVRLVG